MSLELVFPALGKTLPTDHAYALYAALSGIVPKFHDKDSRRCCMKPLAGEVVWPALLLTLCSQWLQPPDGAR